MNIPKKYIYPRFHVKYNDYELTIILEEDKFYFQDWDSAHLAYSVSPKDEEKFLSSYPTNQKLVLMSQWEKDDMFKIRYPTEEAQKRALEEAAKYESPLFLKDEFLGRETNYPTSCDVIHRPDIPLQDGTGIYAGTKHYPLISSFRHLILSIFTMGVVTDIPFDFKSEDRLIYTSNGSQTYANVVFELPNGKRYLIRPKWGGGVYSGGDASTSLWRNRRDLYPDPVVELGINDESEKVDRRGNVGG